jgi:hypothetical protein
MSQKIMLHGRLQEGVAEAAGSAPYSGTTPERTRQAGSNAARPGPRWPDRTARAGDAGQPWPGTPPQVVWPRENGAALASVTSMSIGADGHTVELDTAQIVAAVSEALLWAGALPPDSALLSGGTGAGRRPCPVAGAAGSPVGRPRVAAGMRRRPGPGRPGRQAAVAAGHGGDREHHRG